MPTIPIRWSDNTDELKRHLKEGLSQIEATKAGADKLAQSLGGDNLVRAAHNFSAAIQKLGGVQNLTASNQARVNSVMTRAVEVLNAAGKGASDVSRHFQGLANATQQIKPLPPSFGEQFFGNLSGQITGIATGFVSAQAVIGGFSKAVDLAQASVRTLTQFLTDSVQSFAEAEAAQKKLTTALVAQGTATPEVIDQYSALSTQMQRTTVFSDDLTTQMEALLVQVGDIMPTQMERAIKASADLAAGLGVDLQTATTLVAKAAAGHTETLGKYGISVDKAALATEGFSAVLDAINKQFGGQAAAQLDTYAGRVQQIANAWDNVKEAIGKAIVNNPLIVKGLRDTADGMNTLDQQASSANFTFSQLLNTARDIGGDPVLLDFLVLATAYLENAADEANQLAAALRSIKPPAGFTTDTTPKGFFKQQPASLGGDVGGLALDKALARAKKDNAEVQKILDELHKKALAAFEAWFKVGEAATKALSIWKAEMLPSDQIAEGFATVTDSLTDLQAAIDETDAVAAGFNKDKTLIIESLDEMARKAKETEDAFRTFFGVLSGLSMALPAGQLPSGKVPAGKTAAQFAEEKEKAEQLDQTIKTLVDDLRLFGDTSDSTFGAIASGLATLIPAFQSTIAAINAATNAMLTLNAALGVFGLGFLIGSVIVRRIRGGATGGVVTPSGIQPFSSGGMVQPFSMSSMGTDTVPAMLTPGEVVLNRAQQASLGTVHYHTHNWDLRQAVVTNDQGLQRLSREVAKRNATGVARNQDSVNTRGRAGYGLRS